MRSSAGMSPLSTSSPDQRGHHAHVPGPDRDRVEQLHAVGIGIDAVLARTQHVRHDALGALAGDDLARRQLLAVQPGHAPPACPAGMSVMSCDLPAPCVGVPEVAAFGQHVQLDALLARLQRQDLARRQVRPGLADQDGDLARPGSIRQKNQMKAGMMATMMKITYPMTPLA